MARVRQISYVRLQLFEEHQTQGHDCLVTHISYVLGLFDAVNVEEHVGLLLQQVGVLFDEALNEFGDKKHCPAVLKLDVLHFL